MWTCPSCGRRFKHRNQMHTCQVFDLDKHLFGKPSSVAAIYHVLADRVSEAGEMEVVPMKTSILFRVQTAFASVMIRRRWVDVVFAVETRLKSSRVRRIEQVSATRIAYRVRLSSPDDVDEELLVWLNEARELSAR